MIVTCEKCSKKFNIDDNLIPDEGRELQCGSCNYKWFFKKSKNTITLKNEISETLYKDDQLDNANISVDNQNKNKELKKTTEIKKVKKNPKIIKNGLVIVISIIALIVLLDTFKYQLNNYIPELDSILNNLYESLKDLSLFFKDLVN